MIDNCYKWAWRDGDIVDGQRWQIDASNPALLGVGVFTTIAVFSGRARFLKQHWSRLQSGCAQIGLECPDFDRFQSCIEEMLARNGNPDRCRVKIIVVPKGNLAHYLGGRRESLVTATAFAAAPPFPTTRALTLPIRIDETSPLAGLKSISYLENMWGLRWVHERGADDGIFLNTQGFLCESTSANLFYKTAAGWITPPLSTGCIAGVTRKIVMDLCRDMDIDVREETQPVDAWRTCTAAFLTSSVRLLRIVVKIDGRQVDSPGDADVAAVQQKLRDIVEDNR